jgi:NADH-quinone oxidoreductase subunit J
MIVSQIIFYILSAIALAGAAMVIFHRNPVYNVLALVVTFFAIAGHFLLLSAQFLAAVHIIVYAGAIMVLFLYVIMMLNLNVDSEPVKPLIAKVGAVVGGGALMLVLVAALKSAEKMSLVTAAKIQGITIDLNGDPKSIAESTATYLARSSAMGTIESLGQSLYKTYILPFEVSAILFLVGMVGAVMLGKKEIQ